MINLKLISSGIGSTVPVSFRDGEVHMLTLQSDHHGPFHPFPHLEIARQLTGGREIDRDMVEPRRLYPLPQTTYERLEADARDNYFLAREEILYAAMEPGRFRDGAEEEGRDAGTEGKGRFWAMRALGSIVDQLFHSFIPKNVGVIAEAGCGPSHLFKQLIPESYQGARYIGFDVAPLLVRAARQADHAADIRDGSMYAPPLDDNSVDVYASLSSFDVLFRMGLALAQARRVLKPNGLFFCVQDVHPASHNFFGYGIEHPEERRTLHLPVQRDFKNFDDFMNHFVGLPICDKSLYEVDGVRLTLWDEFQARLLGSLKHQGFTVVAHGLAHAFFVGSRTERHPSNTSQNHFVDYMGTQMPAHNPLLSSSLIVTASNERLNVPYDRTTRSLRSPMADIMGRLGRNLVVEEKYAYFCIAQSPA